MWNILEYYSLAATSPGFSRKPEEANDVLEHWFPKLWIMTHYWESKLGVLMSVLMAVI